MVVGILGGIFFRMLWVRLSCMRFLRFWKVLGLKILLFSLLCWRFKSSKFFSLLKTFGGILEILFWFSFSCFRFRGSVEGIFSSWFFFM